MCPSIAAASLVILLLITATASGGDSSLPDAISEAKALVSEAKSWAYASLDDDESRKQQIIIRGDELMIWALKDCAMLYDDTDYRLDRLLLGGNHSVEDAHAWLSGAFASHQTCLDGLAGHEVLLLFVVAHNLTASLRRALALHAKLTITANNNKRAKHTPSSHENEGLLASWSAATSKADLVVAKDGSGTHRTINEAVAALARMLNRRPAGRVVVYVKSGVYDEKVEIPRGMNDLMFVGDGMDKTVVTGRRNVIDGSTTLNSASFGVSGDGFWARDMTFENTAGPQKHQAVALRSSSDRSIFYRCSFKAYQDTLLTHSLRQFYRDCHIYGTVDFIFGDAATVFQNCNIFIRRPMSHQANMVTAQGRDDPNSNTGITIHNSRIYPAPDLAPVKGSFKNYLGRPWKRYSRTVVLKTDLDGLIHPKGWNKWSGDFALSTLFYGEYMNVGQGAAIERRVRWPGFHVLRNDEEVGPYLVANFIQGDSWIPEAGVPFSLGT